jgi:hypothetical protein
MSDRQEDPSKSSADWQPLVVDSLTGDAIAAAMSGDVPYVHIPCFLDSEWCEEVVQRFNTAITSMPQYARQTMGPALLDTLAKPVEMFAHSDDPAEYFSYVEEDAPHVRALFDGGEDPLATIRNAWTTAGWTEVPATQDERRYHPDAVWGLRDAVAPPHIDAYERDRVSTLSRFERHINYNVYFQNADSGGDFIVYQRRATAVPAGSPPGSIEFVLESAVLSDTARHVHHPAPGDLVIFDAMLYHEVTQVDGAKNARIQEHSNILVDPKSREFLTYV